jgi:uncharacterized protein YndB with AHSA1/START domain
MMPHPREKIWRALTEGPPIEVWLMRDDVEGSRPDAWRYVVEVQDAGKPADATGYR